MSYAPKYNLRNNHANIYIVVLYGDVFMKISKKSQGSPIGLIVAAVIGLIVIVVVIAMLSGKLGVFGKGTQDANTCDSLCRAAGYGGHAVGNPETPGIKDDSGTQCKCA